MLDKIIRKRLSTIPRETTLHNLRIHLINTRITKSDAKIILKELSRNKIIKIKKGKAIINI